MEGPSIRAPPTNTCRRLTRLRGRLNDEGEEGKNVSGWKEGSRVSVVVCRDDRCLSQEQAELQVVQGSPLIGRYLSAYAGLSIEMKDVVIVDPFASNV